VNTTLSAQLSFIPSVQRATEGGRQSSEGYRPGGSEGSTVADGDGSRTGVSMEPALQIHRYPSLIRAKFTDLLARYIKKIQPGEFLNSEKLKT
jgi:hypothetical protein